MDEQNLHNELFSEEQEHLSAAYKRKVLERSSDDAIIAGVCSGIAKYVGKDPATIRIIAMMLLLLGAWIVAAYLITAFFLPIAKHDESLSEETLKKISRDNFRAVLSGALITTGFYFALEEFGLATTSSILFLPNSFMFPLLAIAVGVFILTNKFSKSAREADDLVFSKSTNDKMLFGVCGGLAKYLNVDSSSLRIIFVLLSGLTLGVFAIGYLILSVTTKVEEQEQSTINE